MTFHCYIAELQHYYRRQEMSDKEKHIKAIWAKA